MARFQIRSHSDSIRNIGLLPQCITLRTEYAPGSVALDPSWDMRVLPEESRGAPRLHPHFH